MNAQPSHNKKDSCKITISCKDFDFFARTLVKSHELDTLNSLLLQENHNKDTIILLQIQNRASDSLLLYTKQSEFIACNLAYGKLVDQHNKQGRKLKFFKNTSLIFGSMTVILVSLLLLGVK